MPTIDQWVQDYKKDVQDEQTPADGVVASYYKGHRTGYKQGYRKGNDDGIEQGYRRGCRAGLLLASCCWIIVLCFAVGMARAEMDGDSILMPPLHPVGTARGDEVQTDYERGFNDGMECISLVSLESNLTGSRMTFGQMADVCRGRRAIKPSPPCPPCECKCPYDSFCDSHNCVRMEGYTDGCLCGN